jgi:hypothetical protein
MESAQNIVSLAYQSLGYFVIQGKKAGNNEIDLLAIKLDTNNHVLERLHIEVQVSANPVGVLRSSSKFKKTLNNPLTAVKDYIDKKFHNKKIIKVIEKIFGDYSYHKVFVYGNLKAPDQLKVFKDNKIKTIFISDLINSINYKELVHELKRNLDVIGILSQNKMKRGKN